MEEVCIAAPFLGVILLRVPVRYRNLYVREVGSHSAVCSAFDYGSNQHVVIKKIRRPFQNEETAKRAYREMRIMRHLRHPNIIRLLNVFRPPGPPEEMTEVYLVTERTDGDLRRIIPLRLDNAQISFIVYQLLRGIQYLHAANIIHRDLKPSNIGVDWRPSNVAGVAADVNHLRTRILDFGLARTRGPARGPYMTPQVVTRFYRAPEVILGLRYDEQVDVWAVGCIMGELIRKQILFHGEDILDQWDKISGTLGTPSATFLNQLGHVARDYALTQNYAAQPFEVLFPDHNFHPPIDPNWQHLSAESARDLLSQMLVIDPRTRITVDDALCHPFIQGLHMGQQVPAPLPAPLNLNEVERNRPIEQWRNIIAQEVDRWPN